ncbi:DEAD/DEAH box helicase family protein, partial [Limosilactobacillus fermentum]
MESNFTFLEQDLYAKVLQDNAQNSEKAYLNRDYSSVFTNIRVIYEHVIKQVIDFSYSKYDPDRGTFADNLKYAKREKLIGPELFSKMFIMKQGGNKAAHELSSSIYYTKDQALSGLKNEYDVLNWYVKDVLHVDYEQAPFMEPQSTGALYATNERKVIYAQSVVGEIPMYAGSEKVGETTIDDFDIDMKKNSDDLRAIASHRISQYMKTAGLHFNVDWAQAAYSPKNKRWFSDHDVHDVLIRSGIKHNKNLNGNEWFKTNVETVKQAIEAVKNGQSAITVTGPEEKPAIVLRPEQAAAVKKTKKAFKKYDKMLWNAKMRFGKTLSALQLVKEEGYQHVLIMTHRPVVDEGWFEDFNKIGMPEAGYRYGSRQTGEIFANLANSEEPFVYFASLQDLRGSEMAGGKAGDKNEELFNTAWDLVIIDEAHEGTQTELAQNVTNLVVTPDHTKLLELSGTPFNILDQYEEDQVFTWDYVMEQKAKLDWETDYPGERNPYEGLPKVSMYTFEMNRVFEGSKFIDELTKSFNFKEFFRVDDQGEFVYKAKVKQFLDNITSPDKATNYPFSTEEFRNRLRHTLWILPGVKEAGALEKMLKNHPVFGMDYRIVNVVKDLKNDRDDNGVASESDVQRVKEAIGPDAASTKTITLTVRKLTTGVTIKPWTGVVFLSNTNSAMQYLQAAFRAQTPYCSETFGKKTNCYIFDFAPDRALKVMAESSRLSSGVGKRVSKTQKDKMRELLNFLPIIGEEGHGMKPFKVDSLLTKIKKIYAEKAVQTGFDDDSLYSDELLMLDKEAIDEFNKLKAIVGQTKQEKKKETVDVN